MKKIKTTPSLKLIICKQIHLSYLHSVLQNPQDLLWRTDLQNQLLLSTLVNVFPNINCRDPESGPGGDVGYSERPIIVSAAASRVRHPIRRGEVKRATEMLIVDSASITSGSRRSSRLLMVIVWLSRAPRKPAITQARRCTRTELS